MIHQLRRNQFSSSVPAAIVEIFKPIRIREGVSAFFLKRVSQLWTHRFPMNCTISCSIGKVKMSYQLQNQFRDSEFQSPPFDIITGKEFFYLPGWSSQAMNLIVSPSLSPAQQHTTTTTQNNTTSHNNTTTTHNNTQQHTTTHNNTQQHTTTQHHTRSHNHTTTTQRHHNPQHTQHKTTQQHNNTHTRPLTPSLSLHPPTPQTINACVGASVGVSVCLFPLSSPKPSKSQFC